ncbi:hypothetical protein MHU86_10141 [Fragilaria crotonensis]|nr:hypothetical protein MHU86_10141 [Fragilaria crotonensis]
MGFDFNNHESKMWITRKVASLLAVLLFSFFLIHDFTTRDSRLPSAVWSARMHIAADSCSLAVRQIAGPWLPTKVTDVEATVNTTTFEQARRHLPVGNLGFLGLYALDENAIFVLDHVTRNIPLFQHVAWLSAAHKVGINV